MKTYQYKYATPYLTNEPPHLATRGLSYLLMLMFVTLLIASITIKVPETISAPFVLAPQRGTDPVRASRRGIIQQVELAEGQAVAQGAKLFVIRSEQTGDQSADLRTLEMQLRSTHESLRLASDRYHSQQQGATGERARLQGQFEHLERMAELKIGEQTLAREVSDSYAQLRKEGLAGTTISKEKQNEVTRLTGQLEQLRNEQRDTRAALERFSHTEEMQRNEYSERERGLREEIEKAKIQTASLGQWVAQNQGSQFAVSAPCSGTILKLHVKTRETVVAEGEVLCELTCASEELQAELKLPQSGAGRVKIGQGIKLLYDAFPYQQFGVKFANLRWISPSTSTTDFRALADLASTSIQVAGQATPLKAGMAGRAEVVIAHRSIISFAFDPIRQLRENMVSPPAEQTDAQTAQLTSTASSNGR